MVFGDRTEVAVYSSARVDYTPPLFKGAWALRRDLPSIGFCIEPLLVSKYDGSLPVHWALAELAQKLVKLPFWRSPLISEFTIKPRNKTGLRTLTKFINLEIYKLVNLQD
jgi:hypothetical protein